MINGCQTSNFTPNSVRVFLIDDHKIVIQGLLYLLENAPWIEVIGYAFNKEKLSSSSRMLPKNQTSLYVITVFRMEPAQI